MPPRRRPPWWPQDEPWPPERWAGGRPGPPVGGGPPWGRGWGHERHGGPLLVGFVVRAFGFLLLAIAFVTLVGYVGAAIVGVATAPLGVVAVGLLAIAGLGVGLGVAWRALRRAGRPLERLVDAAGRVQAGDYTVRVAEEGTAGMRSLVRAFNQMSARLEAGDTARRTFLADVSHELRTPLTVIRAQTEAIADGVYPADAAHLRPVLDQAAVLERLVEDLRAVALAEAGALEVRWEPVDLTLLITAVVDALQAPARDAGVVLGFAATPPSPTVAADPALLRRAILNLLTNALRHTPSPGSVTVAIETGLDTVAISVTDTGPGIPAEIRERVFDRFVRGPGSTGSGLGLAIARDIALAHGGTLDLEQPTDGGTRMVLRLPT